MREAARLGFEEIGINTNGMRLAQDSDLCRELMECGVNKVSLQFDGVRDATYRRIRGRDLFQVKVQVLENVRKQKGGVVWLVCAVGRDLNDQEIPGILDFAAQNADVVSGVSFLPIAFRGRRSDPADLDGRPLGHSSHPQCGSLQIVYATRGRGGGWAWRSVSDLLDLPKIEADSETLWRRHQDKPRGWLLGPKMMQARMIWIVLKNVPDRKLVGLEAPGWLMARGARAVCGLR